MLSTRLAVWALLLAGCAAAQNAHRPKILLIYDMEGLSGVLRPEYTRAAKPEYTEGRKLLTADVNAAVRGLAAGGAAAIWVQDGHGSGNGREPDVLVSELDPRAKFDFRKYPFSAYTTGIDASIDAIVCIGMHARAGGDGFIAHTFNLEIGFRVNDVDFTETHIVAASAARFGIPVIMVSGDDVLGRQLRQDFSDVEYAVVKTARSRGVAEAPDGGPDVAHQRIEQRAKTAMEKFRKGVYRPYFLPPPYRFEVLYRNEQQVAAALRYQGIERAGPLSVRHSSSAYLDGYLLSATLFTVGNDRLEMLIRLLQSDPEGWKLLEKYGEAFWQRFLEPDRAPDWTRSTPPAAAGQQQQRQYYGAQ